MRRTLLCGLAAATFVTITSWSDMAKRAAAKQSAAEVGATHHGVNVAILPVAPMQGYEAY
jgi:hypothetical protein